MSPSEALRQHQEDRKLLTGKQLCFWDPDCHIHCCWRSCLKILSCLWSNLLCLQILLLASNLSSAICSQCRCKLQNLQMCCSRYQCARRLTFASGTWIRTHPAAKAWANKCDFSLRRYAAADRMICHGEFSLFLSKLEPMECIQFVRHFTCNANKQQW